MSGLGATLVDHMASWLQGVRISPVPARPRQGEALGHGTEVWSRVGGGTFWEGSGCWGHSISDERNWGH